MNQTLARERAQRTNPGGQPQHPIVVHLEGHASELIGERDDAKLMTRWTEFLAATSSATERVNVMMHSATSFDGLREAMTLQGHISRVLHKVSAEMVKRAARILGVIVPEITECYEHFEQKYARERAS